MSTQPLQNGYSKIRGLILDYGEVLCHRPGPGKMERMAEIAGMDVSAFTTRYHEERGPYDRGDLTPLEYWTRLLPSTVALTPELIDQLRRWDVEMWTDINSKMIDWLYRVRAAGLKTALLSNMHFDMAEHARRSFHWLKDLDGVILSCELRVIKPAHEIYQRCVDLIQLPPQEVLFVDDRTPNVEAAREVGLHAIQFATTAGLDKELARLGFPVLSEVE